LGGQPPTSWPGDRQQVGRAAAYLWAAIGSTCRRLPAQLARCHQTWASARKLEIPDAISTPSGAAMEPILTPLRSDRRTCHFHTCCVPGCATSRAITLPHAVLPAPASARKLEVSGTISTPSAVPILHRYDRLDEPVISVLLAGLVAPRHVE